MNRIICGDCREVLKTFPRESIDLVIYSPPYYGLRDYSEKAVTVWGGDPNCEHEWVDQRVGLVHENRNFLKGTQEEVKASGRGVTWIRKYDSSRAAYCVKCGAWRGQLGLEPDWRMYIQHLVEINREVKRVLKKTGSLYVVIGDTYAGSHCGRGDKTLFQNFRRAKVAESMYQKSSPQEKAVGYQPKCLMGIPWRFAFAMIEDGWILRNAIIWYKPNHMPESVRDRLTKTYEYIFHFVKSRKYYYNLDMIRVPHKEGVIRWGGDIMKVPKSHKKSQGLAEALVLEDRPWRRKRGKNPGDFWMINTRPFPEAHFAVYPIDICLRPILSSCPPDGVVLDPACGAGTTLLACELINKKMWEAFRLPVNEHAKKVDWRLRWIGIEIVPDYVEIAKKRLKPYICQKTLIEVVESSKKPDFSKVRA